MPAYVAVIVALLVGLAGGFVAGVAATKPPVSTRRGDRITRSLLKQARTGVVAAATAEEGDPGPLPYALQPARRYPPPTDLVTSSPFIDAPSPLISITEDDRTQAWAPAPPGKAVDPMTLRESTGGHATVHDFSGADTRPWEQPLPETEARGVAHPPGPIEPGQRLTRILREETGEHRLPGETTTWLGRHHAHE